MCGIAAIARSVSLLPGDGARMGRMLEALAHRGPDGVSTVESSGHDALVGATRLAIEDPAGGAQPIRDRATGVSLAFNGEIYNHQTLKEQLQRRGHSFRSRCDTEVVLRAYLEWGEAALPRLDGIFAFIISDPRRAEIFFARDPMGVKPLYYHLAADSLWLASELRALAATAPGEIRLDPEGVAEYLSLGYTLAPRTTIDGFFQLPEGTFAVWSRGRLRQSAYFRLRDVVLNGAQEHSGTIRRPNIHVQCEQIISGAVKRQSVSDSSVGTFLSSGIDSSLVATFLREVSPAAPAVTLSMGRPGYSEHTGAERSGLALSLSWRHREFDERHWLDNFAEYAWSSDAPLGDPSFAPTLQLCRAARDSARVMLSGDGGDELFLGYPTYRADRLRRLLVKRGGSSGLRAVGRGLSAIRSRRGKLTLSYQARAFAVGLARREAEAHCGWRELLAPETLRTMATPLIAHSIDERGPQTKFRRLFDEVEGADFLNRMSYVDCRTWLANDIFVKTDRASMAMGLEVRVPLVDKSVVEFAFMLSEREKWSPLVTKRPLRKILRRRLPTYPRVALKKGFGAPVGELMAGPLGTAVERADRGGHLFGPFLREDSWPALLAAHRRRENDYGRFLWSSAVLGLWWNRLRTEKDAR